MPAAEKGGGGHMSRSIDMKKNGEFLHFLPQTASFEAKLFSFFEAVFISDILYTELTLITNTITSLIKLPQVEYVTNPLCLKGWRSIAQSTEYHTNMRLFSKRDTANSCFVFRVQLEYKTRGSC
jgi:hypothetical protein